MYDLEILIPVDLEKDFIIQRFQDFRKWGFRNTENIKIKLWLMTSKNSRKKPLDELINSWPMNFDVQCVITPNNHVSQRIMHYYVNYMKPDTARWYMRIDEDSMTNLGLLLKHLDEWFDHTRDFYIVGNTNRYTHEIERNILEPLGFQHWYFGEHPEHEYEISIVSNSAIKKICENQNCKEYLSLREEFAEGYGDHALCHCARMCKIYPFKVDWIRTHANLMAFSSGKYVAHIHEISRDRTHEVFDWFEFTQNNVPNKELEKEITNNSYFLKWIDRERDWVLFHEDYLISNQDGKVMGLWNFTKNQKLTVFLSDDFYLNNPPLVLEKTDNGFTSADKRIDLKTFRKVTKKIPML
jgi:hypothetical protein